MSRKPQKISNIDITRDPINSKEYCNNSTHEYCTYITEFVQDKLNKNEELSEILLQRYFGKVCNSVECWSYNYKVLLTLTNRIYESFTINDTILKKILVLYNAEIFVLYINSLKNIDTQKITDLFKLIVTIPYSERRIDMNEALINYCILLKNHDILKLCFDNIVDIYCDYNLIEKFLDLKIKPSEEQFYKILIRMLNCESYEDIIKKCILNGIEIKKDTIKKYIANFNNNFCDFYGINYFSDICIYLYKNGSTDIIINDILNILKISIEKFINYLIDDDYKISRDEFKNLCENKIFIKNTKKIEKFLDDEEIKTIIFTNDLGYKIKLNYNIDILRAECLKKNNHKRIAEIATSVKPDNICLENACTLSNNMQTIKLLHNRYGVPITEKCIAIYARKNYYNTMMNYVIDTYNNDNKIVVVDDE